MAASYVNKPFRDSSDDSEYDYVDELSDVSEQADIPLMSTSQFMDTGDFDALQRRFKEACIYLSEGEQNVKFQYHPRTPEAIKAFERTHSTWINLFDLLAALVLVSLIAFERPAIETDFPIMSIPADCIARACCVLALAIKVVLEMQWLGVKTYFSKPRCFLRVLFLLAIVIDVIATAAIGHGNLWITKLLRPFFIVDNVFMSGVRRVLRQIAQSLWPILDMILLLLFFIFMFSIIGFYAFYSIDDNIFFASLQTSFVSLFVLVTTANYPDVMMPAYNESPYSFFFFCIFLIFGLYFLQNLLLAVVYDSFRAEERGKFKKLYMHKRGAIRRAYILLKDDRCGGIPFSHFRSLMKIRSPRRNQLSVRLFFMSLNTSETEAINLEEFYNFYDLEHLRWKQNRSILQMRQFQRASCIPVWMFKAHAVLTRAVKSKYFEIFMDCVVIANTLVIAYDAVELSLHLDEQKYTDPFRNKPEDVVFLVVFWLEVFLKVAAYGPRDFWENGWHMFDFVVTSLSTIGVFLAIKINVFFSLRQLRVLRLFKIKRRFRQILGTMLNLIPSLVSFVIALMTVFYVFAIVGMELFAGRVHPDCCGPAYGFNTTSKYYLNNFDNPFRSFVTLFELMVVNNWQIIMEGFVKAVGSDWVRIYFMLFYLTAVIIVLNVVIAFILETFLSRMSFERKFNAELDGAYVVRDVAMHADAYLRYRARASRREIAASLDDFVYFTGRRKKTMFDCQVLIFRDQVCTWVQEDGVLRTSMAPPQNEADDLTATELQHMLVEEQSDSDDSPRQRARQGKRSNGRSVQFASDALEPAAITSGETSDVAGNAAAAPTSFDATGSINAPRRMRRRRQSRVARNLPASAVVRLPWAMPSTADKLGLPSLKSHKHAVENLLAAGTPVGAKGQLRPARHSMPAISDTETSDEERQIQRRRRRRIARTVSMPDPEALAQASAALGGAESTQAFMTSTGSEDDPLLNSMA